MPTQVSRSRRDSRAQRTAAAQAREHKYARFEHAINGRQADPLRHPEAGTTTERSKRAFILLGLTLLFPGGAQTVAGPRGLGRFGLAVTLTVWALVVLAGLATLINRGLALDIVANPTVQMIVVVGLMFLAVLWFILWVSTAGLIKFQLLAPGMKPVVGFLTAILMVITSGGLVAGALAVNASRTTLGNIFSSGPALDPVEGRYNFLIMGVDAGEGRVGLRPDSISVASINEDSGQIVLFSIPRNFQNAQFSQGSPLWEVYPQGYNCGDECIINALYTDVTSQYAHLYPQAQDPGAAAMMDAAGGILNLDIQSYVMIDMEGFTKLIDAMGGVTVTTGGWVIHRGVRPDNGQWGNIWWGPGTYTFDGDDALAFARSRTYSSDYSRIRRQQCIQQAMLSQFDLPTLLTRFQGILEAGEQIVETDLPGSQIGTFMDLGVKSQQQPMQRLTIGAPDFGEQGDRFSTYPDFVEIHQRVDEMLAADNTAQSSPRLSEETRPHPATVGTVLPRYTPGTQLLADISGDEVTGEERGSGESNNPDDWPPVPTQPDGSEITEEYLMWLDDTGQTSLAEQASATNQYCAPA